jgi:hypothetical protein
MIFSLLGVLVGVQAVAQSSFPCPGLPVSVDVAAVHFTTSDAPRVVKTISFPRLRGLSCSASFLEYGTDFHFKLPANESVELSVRSVDGGPSLSTRKLNMNTVSLESSVLAATRRLTPFYVDVKSPGENLTIRIYLPRSSRDEGKVEFLNIVYDRVNSRATNVSFDWY